MVKNPAKNGPQSGAFDLLYKKEINFAIEKPGRSGRAKKVGGLVPYKRLYPKTGDGGTPIWLV